MPTLGLVDLDPLERSLARTTHRAVPVRAERDILCAFRIPARALHVRTTDEPRRVYAAQAHPQVPVVLLLRDGFVLLAGLIAHDRSPLLMT